MKKMISGAIALAFLAAPALANEPYGIWQTKTDKTGAYLHVKVEPCKGNSAQLCGIVHQTFKTPHTEIKGRKIFWDLDKVDGNEWGNGTVWDAETDKEYKAKVTLGKTKLRVEGCVGFLCDGQNWTRVK